MNKAGASALLGVFSARVKKALLEGPYSFLSGHREAVAAFTDIAQDGTFPL